MDAVGLLVLVGTMFIAGLAGRALAKRKGRPESVTGWTVLCVLLPVAVPILSMLKRHDVGERVKGWPSMAVIIAANLIIVGQVAVWGVGLAYQGSMGLPTCGSIAAVDTAKQAVANAPMGRVLGVGIVDIMNAQEVSSTGSPERRCTATAMMNNATDRTINYRIFTRDNSDTWYINVDFVN